MAIVAMTNQKGGVGKTSTTMHLGGALARRGLRVLLVDNDPQCSLTKGLLGDRAGRSLPPESTIQALYAGLPVGASEVVRPTGYDALALLAGSPTAGSFNLPDPHLLPPDDQGRLGEGLAPLAADFDLTIVDSCPNLQLCTWAALLAADAAVIPTQAEVYGAQGLAEVRDWIALVERCWGRVLPVAGVVVTMFNGRRAMHKAFVELLAAECPELLTAPVPHAADFPEAVAAGRPIHWHKPRGASAKAIDAVADELLGRLATLGLAPTSIRTKEAA